MFKELKFVVYLRRSSKDNEDKQMRSIEGQEEDLKEVVQRNGINVIKVIRESRTAFEVGRPGFGEIIELIERGGVNAVLVWHPNRIARNYKDGGDFVQLMSDGKLKMVLTPHSIFQDNSRDKEYLMNEFTKATRDSDDKKEAVIRGNKIKLRQGYIPSGRLPDWLIHTKDKDGRMINDIDPDRYPLLKKAIGLVLNGTATPREALAILNKDWGFRTRKTRRVGGRPLSKSAWYRTLSDPMSYGDLSERTQSKETQQTSFPTLMSENEFEIIQVILGNKSKRRQTRKNWPYNGRMTCGECGSRIITDEKWQIVCTNCKTKFHKAKNRESCPSCNALISEMKKPKIFHYKWIRCCKSKVRSDGLRCTQKSFKVDDFEKQVDDYLAKIEIPESFSDWAIKWLKKLNKEEVGERTHIHKSLQDLYNETQKQIDELLDLRLRKLISDGEYNKKKETLLLEKKEINSKLGKSDDRANNWLEMAERTFNFSTHARYWFANGTNEQKRGILKALDSNIFFSDGTAQIQLQKPLLFFEDIQESKAVELAKLEHTKNPVLLEEKEYSEASFPSLLPSRDLNPDFRVQSAACYHYTTGHYRLCNGQALLTKFYLAKLCLLLHHQAIELYFTLKNCSFEAE